MIQIRAVEHDAGRCRRSGRAAVVAGDTVSIHRSANRGRFGRYLMRLDGRQPEFCGLCHRSAARHKATAVTNFRRFIGDDYRISPDFPGETAFPVVV